VGIGCKESRVGLMNKVTCSCVDFLLSKVGNLVRGEGKGWVFEFFPSPKGLFKDMVVKWI
jgi:hypothetical protein